MSGILAEANFLVPTQASTMAAEIDWLTWFIVWICVIFGAIIFIGTLYIGVKFRYRPGHPEKGVGATHSTFLEIFWSVIPAIIVMLIAIWGFQGYMKFNIAPPVTDLEVLVDGQKWSWDFTYPNGHREPTLHIYKGAAVRFVLASRDVIHSLYFPQFRVKKDVVPGRYNKLWVIPTEISSTVEGSPLTADNNYEAWTKPENFKFDFDNPEKPQDGFDIYCAEYCGTRHSKMLTKVYVHPTRENFLQWLANASDLFRKNDKGEYPKTTEIGKVIANKNGCFGCHSVDGAKNTGPTWKDMFGKMEKMTDGSEILVDENYIRESIEYPSKHIVAGYSPAMSSYLGKFKPEEYTALMSYMKSISANYKGNTTELDLPPAEVVKRDQDKAAGKK